MQEGNHFFQDCYATYGLTDNPFAVQALGADEVGHRLMVGRDDEVHEVAMRLHKPGKITCLDGHIGVGKTSLVNVATYKCLRAFLENKTGQLLIPLEESFQLSRDEDVNALCDRVFRKVANGLLSQREHLGVYRLPVASMNQLDAWLNSPVVRHLNGAADGSVTLGIPGASATVKSSGSQSSQMNTGSGFTQEGFETLVKKWLNQIFQVQGSGGVVCVIDNLELLETGASARRTLESLRDRLFNVNGLRWVFCGANGVIHSLAASNRLGSFLNKPIIDVRNIKTTNIRPLILARLGQYSTDVDATIEKLPIRIEDIETLYPIINFNLRELLSCADEYCDTEFRLGRATSDPAQKARRFGKWLEKSTTDSYNTLSSRMPQDAWVVLDIAMSDMFKGTFGTGNYGSFNSNSKLTISQPNFLKWLREMVKLELINKTVDDNAGEDDGFKRDVFSVTAKGALVHYARLMKQETRSLAPMTWLKRVHY